jgi:hypothetical protein
MLPCIADSTTTEGRYAKIPSMSCRLARLSSMYRMVFDPTSPVSGGAIPGASSGSTPAPSAIGS